MHPLTLPNPAAQKLSRPSPLAPKQPCRCHSLGRWPWSGAGATPIAGKLQRQVVRLVAGLVIKEIFAGNPPEIHCSNFNFNLLIFVCYVNKLKSKTTDI